MRKRKEENELQIERHGEEEERRESKRREKTAKYLTSERRHTVEEEREREMNADLNRRRKVKLNEMDKKRESPERRILGRETEIKKGGNRALKTNHAVKPDWTTWIREGPTKFNPEMNSVSQS